MKKPNFFIIGAPKCGTTSLAAWLGEHPQIYMSPAKEPHHFNTDDKHCLIRNRRDYERLFFNANEQHIAVGEASVWYMYSREAIPNIERYRSGAKYIVCLRNPIEMAYSLHEQLIVSCHENEHDFATAWQLQWERIHGKSIPKLCREPRYLAYGPVCSLGEQLQRVYSYVPVERVLPLLLDDVKHDPRTVYLTLLRFLNVEDDGRSSFPVLNTAKALRIPALQKIVRLLSALKRSTRIKGGLGILNTINRSNIRYRARTPMPNYIAETMKDYFCNDINKLSGLIKRDLSHWLSK